MAISNLSSLDGLFKVMYPDRKIQSAVYKDHPFLAKLKKNERKGGKSIQVPVVYGAGAASRSKTFATAQTNAAASNEVEFSVTRGHDYAIIRFDNEAAQAAMFGDGAVFKDMFQFEVDSKLRAIGNALSADLFGTGGASIGRISSDSTVGSSTITLTDINRIVNFEVGMNICLSSADGTGSLRSSGDSAAITDIDRDAGTLSFAGNLTAEIAAAAASDYIFAEGDHGASILKGLGAWIPASAPGATAFYGVDRTADVTRLGGCRIDGSSIGLLEAINSATVRISREGGSTDLIVMNHIQWQNLQNEMQGSWAPQTKSLGEVNYESVMVHTPSGSAEVVCDRFCPGDQIYCLTSDSWELGSLGKVPKLLSQGVGGISQYNWVYNGDTIEGRLGYYAALYCYNPGFNGVITGLATT